MLPKYIWPIYFCSVWAILFTNGCRRFQRGWGSGVWTFLIYESSYIFSSISDQVSGFLSLILYIFLLSTLLFKRHPMVNDETCWYSFCFVGLCETPAVSSIICQHYCMCFIINSNILLNCLCMVPKYYDWLTADASFNVVTVLFSFVILVMTFWLYHSQ